MRCTIRRLFSLILFFLLLVVSPQLSSCLVLSSIMHVKFKPTLCCPAQSCSIPLYRSVLGTDDIWSHWTLIMCLGALKLWSIHTNHNIYVCKHTNPGTENKAVMFSCPHTPHTHTLFTPKHIYSCERLTKGYTEVKSIITYTQPASLSLFYALLLSLTQPHTHIYTQFSCPYSRHTCQWFQSPFLLTILGPPPHSCTNFSYIFLSLQILWSLCLFDLCWCLSPSRRQSLCLSSYHRF